IRSAPNNESHSLMTKYRVITTSRGIVITLGHPSYANELTTLNSFLAYYNNMTPAEQYRFNGRLQTLYFIRKIQIPGVGTTSSIYQNYQALGLLESSDLRAVQKAIGEMRSEIIEPRFGIREVVCPTCGEVIKGVTYRNIMDLLFLHTQLESYLTEQPEGQTEA
ncbi:MAG: hypothetical protein K2F99_01560, partial [Muribaculaceae bacterium]|nr:hypothetical protein [Muribaculaceae bacterium]